MNLKKKFYICLHTAIVLVCFIFIMYLTISCARARLEDVEETTASAVQDTTEELAIPEVILIDEPILYKNLNYYEFTDIVIIDLFIARTETAINNLVAECSLADKYTAEATTLMIEEIDRLNAEQTLAMRLREQLLLWAEKEEEYYYATNVWKYLKALGYSDVACAGILGNLMAECGGGTLKLQPFLYEKATGKYYGMFQWSIKYYPQAEGMSFEEQLDYYAETSPLIFKTWGNNYANGFTMDDFNKLTDPREAALAFAKIYERCASWTYECRQNFAEIAYQYFVTDFENLITA